MEILILGISVLIPLIIIYLYATYKQKQEERREQQA